MITAEAYTDLVRCDIEVGDGHNDHVVCESEANRRNAHFGQANEVIDQYFAQ
jgi:1,4-dihydroxy-2-naphthoyl-CoA synthase